MKFSAPIKSSNPLSGKRIQSYQTEDELHTDTENLRKKLVELVCKEGTFSSLAVLEMSQQLDEYIVHMQKRIKSYKH
ncbi:aspartyl-phosphate phosphatase Spo0E family protein [Brevibacillus sp. 7WMA2]|uniref:aspartyl-phosphate phosphatase Spo0E family protein n=1 Tax=Brevibacillus TaxID=55080 RepID=UPI00021501FB|nr:MULTISPECIES: aspartyl-phosphate phosphatase Spo0E family protein [Brevibacillus]MBA4533060.1 aspartyl-phosphate phosphatase Spo0E family protein [Brevibacillus halotolerans]HAS01630.1 aspartyl-phosphate phosphatase Spo0E family protein [Brevibacillus sp.]AUM66247.1 aspartyl-phosphate phosphatase Spo0E family protein [Brevibacillus laterosporus]AYK05188.1 aspartyl-phosphate phosphatase Spo0E family protein [Brevibacillus laterosporus]MCR8995503.1 aspartyl-phosphate phosphatase Spo0E family 